MKITFAICVGLTLALSSGRSEAQSKPEDPVQAETRLPSSPENSSNPCSEVTSTIDLLTDTQGANLRPYVRSMLMSVRENWYRLMQESALTKTSCLAITFTVQRDGHVADMRVERTSGDDALDQAAWKSIESNDPFRSFPTAFTGDHLALRFHFVYNPNLHSNAVQNAKAPAKIISTSEDGPVYAVGHGVTPPRATYMPSAEYSDKARKKKIQGTVLLQIVITAEGTVRDAKVTTSLEPSLDKQALLSVKSWKFQPAMKDGVPVAVQLAAQVSFHLY